MVNEDGWLCAGCNDFFDVEELTIDHIQPRWVCLKEHYQTKQNRHLLCKTCHKSKASLEYSFMARIVQRIIEHIHLNDVSTVDISEIIQEYKELMQAILLKEWKILR